MLFVNPSTTFVAPGITVIAAIGAFAILARGLLIIEDLAGVPQIVKSTSLIFTRNKTAETPKPPAPPVNPV